MNNIKEWIVTVVYSDQDYPVTPYRILATDEEIQKVMKSFVTPLIEEWGYKLDFDEEEFSDENSLSYYADLFKIHVDVTAVNLDNMQVHRAKQFLEAEGGK